ncbi:MAG: T9SS type A sorting domain-containing protein, partial [Bacteroidota bacterium]
PNPFSDRIQVEGLMGDEKFTLLNSLGAVLYEGGNIDQFSTTRLTPGIYFLRIGSGQSVLTQKLIKQN